MHLKEEEKMKYLNDDLVFKNVFSKEEILQDLKAMHNPNKDFAIKVIKRVPFIKENEEALKRKLNKRKDK